MPNLKNNTSLISNDVGNCYWNCKRILLDVCGFTTNITFGLQVSETENRCYMIVRIEIFVLYDISVCFFRVTRFILYIIIKVESFNCRVTTATAIAYIICVSFGCVLCFIIMIYWIKSTDLLLSYSFMRFSHAYDWLIR